MIVYDNCHTGIINNTINNELQKQIKIGAGKRDQQIIQQYTQQILHTKKIIPFFLVLM